MHRIPNQLTLRHPLIQPDFLVLDDQWEVRTTFIRMLTYLGFRALGVGQFLHAHPVLVECPRTHIFCDWSILDANPRYQELLLIVAAQRLTIVSGKPSTVVTALPSAFTTLVWLEKPLGFDVLQTYCAHLKSQHSLPPP